MQLLSSRSLAREVASPVIATLGLGRGTKATTGRTEPEPTPGNSGTSRGREAGAGVEGALRRRAPSGLLSLTHLRHLRLALTPSPPLS